MAGTGGVRSTSWKKGEAPVKKKGSKSYKTKLKESLGLQGWSKLSSFINNEGSSKFVLEMQKLSGKDYIFAFSTLAEFVKPKLARVEHSGDEGGPIKTVDLSNLTFAQLYELKYGRPPATADKPAE